MTKGKLSKEEEQRHSETFEEFEARIWDTVLPNGVKLCDATGEDILHAGEWFAKFAERLERHGRGR